MGLKCSYELTGCDFALFRWTSPATLTTVSEQKSVRAAHAPKGIPMSHHSTRRDLLKSAAAISAGTWCGVTSWAAPSSANEKLNVAFVGVAGRGARNLAALGPLVNVAALCDVDSQRLTAASAEHPNATKWADFRTMLEQQSDIDAVSISTPDHTHACIAVSAMRAGKHVYCEKPLAHSVYEARLMAETAAKAGVVTQMGQQRHGDPRLRTAVEMIRAGIIGEVSEVHIWSGKNVNWSAGDRPANVDPVPDWLNWELWLGPSPRRPYVKDAYAHRNWRSWWNFGTGNLGDMGCHLFDCAYWALNLDFPTKITAEGPPVHPEGAPDGLTCRFEFPARGFRPDLPITWYDGTHSPPWETIEGVKVLPPQGTLFVGEKGKLLFPHNEPIELILDGKSVEFNAPKQTIPRVEGQNPNHAEWVNAIHGSGTALSNFAYSGRLTEVVQSGVVAYRAGQTLEWDGLNMKALNCDTTALVRPQFRKPWADVLSSRE